MALPATDDFTTGTDQTLDAYSANWTINSGDPRVQASTDDVWSHDGSTFDHFSHWNADSFNDDQYAQVVTTSMGGGQYLGPAVRVHTSAQSGYGWVGDSSDGSYLVEISAGSSTILGSKGGTWLVSDVARLEVTGVNPGTLDPLLNGSTENPPNTQTDSVHDSGYAGINYGGTDASTGRIDDWEGGNLGGESSSVSPSVMLIRSNQIPIHQLQL